MPYDLYLLDPEAASPSGAGVPFEVLPLAAVEQGAPGLSGQAFLRFPQRALQLFQGIDHLLARGVDVLNLSLGPTQVPRAPFEAAVQAATARGTLVVVAAGNWGPDLDTLQPLARLPGVVSVGATGRAGGLLESSSRGIPGGSGPTVVSLGSPLRDGAPPAEPGTSFAAPRVSRAAAALKRMLQVITADLQALQGDAWGPLSTPIPYPVLGIADTGVNPDALPQLSATNGTAIGAGHEASRVSRDEHERAWYQAVVGALTQRGLTADVGAAPATVKRAVEQAARPLMGYMAHEAGAGFLSSEEVSAFLANFRPSRFWALFGRDRGRSANPLADLDDALGSLWTPDRVRAYSVVTLDSQRLAVAKVY